MYDGRDSWGASFSVNNVDDDGIHNLISAMLALAIQDLQRGKGRQGSERERNYYSALRFLESDWFEFMTGIEGRYVLDYLKQSPRRFNEVVAERKEIREKKENMDERKNY